MADVPLLASQAIDAPLDYVIPGAQEIIPKSITASFDGSGAGGDFVPTLVILAPNGAVLAACPTDVTIAAGGSADVSWFPHVSGPGSGRGGLRYNTFPQSGVFLYSDTTGQGGPNNIGTDFESEGGIRLHDTSNQGVNVIQAGDGGVNVQDRGTGGVNVSATGGIGISETGGNDLNVSENNGGDLNVRNLGAGDLRIQTSGGLIGIDAATNLVTSSVGTTQLTAGVNVQAFPTDSFNVVAGRAIALQAVAPIIVDATGGTTESVIQMRIGTNGNRFAVMDDTPIEQFQVEPQGAVVLTVNDKTGAPIFEVRDNGSLHGKTGAGPLVFDL